MIRAPWKRWGQLAPRDRHALVLGGLVLAAALGFRVVVVPYRQALAEVHDRIERERDLLRRERSLLAAVPGYPARFERGKAALLQEAPRLFSGPDLVAATGALSAHVSGQAALHRVFVQQSETQAAEPAGQGVAKLRVELRAVGDLEGLLGLLHSLESGPKLVTVERLVITPAERLTVGAPRDEEVLGITATVAGYALDEVHADSTAPTP